MKVAYGVQSSSDPVVRAWFDKVDRRLRDKTGIMIGGAARHVGDGLYAIYIETTTSFTALMIGPIMLFVSASVLVVFGFPTVAKWLGLTASIGILIGALLVNPRLHVGVMRLTIRKLTGEKIKTRLATNDLIKKVAHGKV